MPGIASIEVTWDDQDRPVIAVRYAVEHGHIDEPEHDQPQHHHPEHDQHIDEWLAAFVARHDQGRREKLQAVIELGPVTLEELAAHLELKLSEVQSWNRNLGRTVKAVVREHGKLRPEESEGTAQVFVFSKNEAGAWLYAVAPEIRETLKTALS